MNYILKNLTDNNRSNNPIEGDFVEYTYENGNIIRNYYHETVDVSEEEIQTQIAKSWRDSELRSTDNVAQTPDYPNRDAILVYRQELRDWPSTDAFPETKPVKP